MDGRPTADADADGSPPSQPSQSSQSSESSPSAETESGTDTPDGSGLGRLLAAAGRIRLRYALLAVAAGAILIRLLFLGARAAHWDEARVAHWIVHYNEFGSFAYRHIIHGPFIQHVNHWLFPILGRTDFAMRLPVAVVGGLLPLSAYLFREHLDRDEVVALALLLATNSVLVYYSRFMRSDVLVAAFMFTALGTLIRFYDTRRFRYLYAFGALVALGFAAKENAIVYLLTWVGALALLLDTGLHRPHEFATGLDRLQASRVGRVGIVLAGLLVVVGGIAGYVLGLFGLTAGLICLIAGLLVAALGALLFPEVGTDSQGGESTAHKNFLEGLLARVDRPYETARRYLGYVGHLLVAGVIFLAVVVFMFAPRGAGLEGIHHPPAAASAGALGLWEALGQPGALPGFVLDTLTYAGNEFLSWFGASTSPGCHKDNIIGGYICFLGRYLRVLLYNAAVLSVLALFGFLYERYARRRSRNLVMFAGYIGLVSIVGYPLGTDVFGAWIVVHAVVPMAVPAAVGVAWLYRRWRDASLNGNEIGAAVAAGLLVLVALQIGVVTGVSVYANHSSENNNLVQYAQPADDLQPAMNTLREVAAEHESGPDVVLYSGPNYSASLVRPPDEEPFNHFRPTCSQWPNTLPLNWYLVGANADVECTQQASELAADEQPPMIIAPANDDTVPAQRLQQNYVPREYLLRAWDSPVTVYVHEKWAGSSATNG